MPTLDTLVSSRSPPPPNDLGHRVGIATRSAQFVYGMLGSDYDDSPYTQTGERVTRLAMSGIRLVIDEFRADVTKTLKNGQRGRLRVDYGDPHKPGDAVRWLWKFVDGAKTAGELYGRALVVICAEQYASRLVVPQKPAVAPDAVELAQGPRRQGAEEARRAAPAGVAEGAREGDRSRAPRARHGGAAGPARAWRGRRSGIARRGAGHRRPGRRLRG